jgi:hypothetical protein
MTRIFAGSGNESGRVRRGRFRSEGFHFEASVTQRFIYRLHVPGRRNHLSDCPVPLLAQLGLATGLGLFRYGIP